MYKIPPEGLISIENLTIYYDNRRDGMISLILHELLHAYMGKYIEIGFSMSEELEEAAILAWEKSLFSYLQKPSNEHLLESWNQAIKRKLEK